MADFLPKRSSEWDEKTKIMAAQTFIKLGNSYWLTAKTLDIPRQTLIHWGKQEWWAALIKELQLESKGEIRGKLGQIIQKSLDIIADRLENGDFMYDSRTGGFIRKPISIRDAHMIVKDNLYLQEGLENKEAPEGDVQSVTDKLQKLAKQFEAIANQKKPVNVTDVVYVETKEEAEDADKS